jgi:methyl-accepting chemotaxis protein
MPVPAVHSAPEGHSINAAGAHAVAAERRGPCVRLKTKVYAGIAFFLLQITVFAGVAASALPESDGAAHAWLFALWAFSTLAGAVAGWYLVSTIFSTFRNIETVVQGLAAGDLTKECRVDVPADLGGLQESLLDFADRLFAIVAKVRLETTSIAVTSSVMSADNAALSARTEEQASSLEETSSTMEELTSTVRRNADNAQYANRLMASLAEQAELGGRAVANAVETMTTIKESSSKIVDIIGVIDGIAFQTNILALNAAVEAARAGSEGRGFAVVASAVRELAQNSAEAARQIKVMINESVARAGAGAHEVGAAGDTIRQVVASVRNVANIINEIAEACAEQSAGIEEINRAVIHIDGVTQKNASLVDELGKTASSLSQQAVDLSGAVSFFQLGDREYGKAEDAVQLVKRGVSFVHAHGKTALIDDVRKLRNSRFVDRDLYFSINDVNGICVANGANPRFVGANGNETRDSDGKYFVREILCRALRDGFGWVDYRYPHPVTKKMQLKSTYFEKVDDIIITCGFYKDKR